MKVSAIDSVPSLWVIGRGYDFGKRYVWLLEAKDFFKKASS